MGTSNTPCVNLFTRETVAFEESVFEKYSIDHGSKLFVVIWSSRFPIFLCRFRIKRWKYKTTVSGIWLSMVPACLSPSGISASHDRWIDRPSAFDILVIRTIWLRNVLLTISNSKRWSPLVAVLTKVKSWIQRTLKVVCGHLGSFFLNYAL